MRFAKQGMRFSQNVSVKRCRFFVDLSYFLRADLEFPVGSHEPVDFLLDVCRLRITVAAAVRKRLDGIGALFEARKECCFIRHTLAVSPLALAFLRKGDYILFVDPDDWLAPNMIEMMLAEGDGAQLIVCGFTDYYQNEDGTSEMIPNPIWREQHDTFVTTDPDYEVLCKTSTVWNKLFRRDVVGNIRFNPELVYGEDSLFTASVLGNVHSTVLIPRPYYYYFRNRKGNVVSATIDDRSLQ